MFATLAAEATDRGDEHTSIHFLWYRSMIEWFRGNWHRALELANEAYETGEQTQFPSTRGWKGRVAALIEADLGLVEQARASAHEGLAQSEAIGNEAFRLLCLGVLGRLELALGDVRAAGGYLRELPGRLLASGMNDPTQPIWADAIETLIVLGELEQARVYLDGLRAEIRGGREPMGGRVRAALPRHADGGRE